MVDYQPYYNTAPYSPDPHWNIQRIDDFLNTTGFLSPFPDGNVSTDSSSAGTASSHPHGQYTVAQYPPTVSQVPLVSVSSADAGITHSYEHLLDPISFRQYAPPQPASLHPSLDLSSEAHTQEWEQMIESILYPSPSRVSSSPIPTPTGQPSAHKEVTVPALAPTPHPNRQRGPPRAAGPERVRRDPSAKSMSPAAASAALRNKAKEKDSNHPACLNCKKGKIKCRPSASGDQCATCLSQRKVCIPSEARSKPPPPTVGSLERRIRQLFAQIEEKMQALGGGAASFSGPNPPPSLEGKACDCPDGNHKPGCRVADPVLLCMRAKLMELRNLDEEDDENDHQDAEMGASAGGSESDDHLSTSSLITPMPPSGTPVGIFFELAHQLGSSAHEAPSNTGSPATLPIGLAGADYFTPGPAAHPEIRRIMIEQGKLPSYLIQKQVSPAECLKLFDLFMKYWNVSVSVLDPALHTAKYVLARCPFLFTVVLAVAARDYNQQYYHLLMKEAKLLAGEAFVEGWKSVEKVQAFILLATFPAPARRHDEDRTWMYLGGAIRMAMDLDLNQTADKPFANERAEREYLNRVRTWIICHNLEVSYGAKTGKPITVQEDQMILSSRTWWQSSPYNMPFDLHLCAFTQICMIFDKYQRKLAPDSNGRTPYVADVLELANQFTKEIDDFQACFEQLFAEKTPQEDEACKYRAHVGYTAHYFRLVIYSHCYRHSSVQGIQPGDPILLYCIDSASRMVQALTEHHAHSAYFKFSAEGWFTFGAFAGAFMIKLLCPQAAPVIDPAQHQHLRALVIRLITAYRSPQVAIDEQHTPFIYAEFLSRLLARADELNGMVQDVVQAPKPDMDELFAKLPLLHTLTT